MTTYIPRKADKLANPLRFRIDVWIALAVLGLLIAGMLVIYSSSFDVAFRSPLSGNDPAFYFRRQAYFLIIGLVAMAITARIDYHFFRYFSILAMGFTVVALIALVILGNVGGSGELGEQTFGATRGFLGGSVQPSELAKLTMILYVSHWLSSKGDRVKSIQFGLVPFSIMVGVVCALILVQPDLSTSALVVLISFSLFFLAGADFRHFFFALIIAVASFWVATQVSTYAQSRIDDWRIAFENPFEAPYQIRLGLITLASGGATGKGVGQGEIKYILPVAHSDFVFAVWGEEWGFAGSLFVIGSFALLGWRGVLAARRARDMYGYLLAMGVTCWICYQALMNIAVVTATMPPTGIPLPFMSYGGSSLVITLVGVGVLLNVSRDAAIGRTLKQSPSALEAIRESINMRRGNRRARVPRTRRSGRVAPQRNPR